MTQDLSLGALLYHSASRSLLALERLKENNLEICVDIYGTLHQANTVILMQDQLPQ